MKIILLACTLFLSSMLFAQGRYTDLKEYGLYGNPRIVNTFYYTDNVFINGNWRPSDTSNYAMKVSYYFDKRGFIDSFNKIIKTTYSVIENKTINQFNNGQKTGSITYRDGAIDETGIIKWLDPFSYTNTTYDTTGNITARYKSILNKQYRDYKGEYMMYEREGDSVVIRSGSHVNSFDENNYLKTALITEDDLKTSIETTYEHDNIDKYKNFLKTVITEKGKNKPKNVAIKRIVYY